MRKRKMVISTISGEKRALVKGKGWIALPKINPNEQVYYIKGIVGEWDLFKTSDSKAREEQQRLLAEGYANGL